MASGRINRNVLPQRGSEWRVRVWIKHSATRSTDRMSPNYQG